MFTFKYRTTRLPAIVFHMSRRALALGEHGEIEASPQKRDSEGKWKRHTSGRGAERWRARAYFRGYDGVIGEASRVAKSKPLAIKAVEAALSEALSAGDGDVTATMPLVRAGKLWLTQIARNDSGLSPRTILDYTATFGRYVDTEGSCIRGLTLAQVNDPQRVRSFLESVADNHGTAAAKIVKTVLSGILGRAVSDGVLSMNAVRQVRPVKSQTPKAPTERDTSRAFTRVERDSVVAYADGLVVPTTDKPSVGRPKSPRKLQTTADMTAFMAGTGVRIGEARALRWEHLDLVQGTAEIHGTKSTSARRRVDLPKWLADRMVTRSQTTPSHGYVFSSPHLSDQERIWDQSNSAEALSDVLIGAGFPWATPHTFRRTVASLLHDAGVPLVKVADQLGHADPTMTARVYLGRDFLGDKSSLAKHL